MQTKRLKFSGSMPELILRGLRTSTWRIADEKGISKGDMLSLCRSDGGEFARAQVTGVREASFGSLNGHEEFRSEGEAYRTYSNRYRMKVVPQTKVKVIEFRVF